jgi:hypothetical protein
MTPQRFLDHAGWWRNRRAVRVEDEALVIEPRHGDEVRVPWVDVIDLYRQGRDAVMVVTPGRVFRFDRGVEGLEALVTAMVAARDAAQTEPTHADVARWLGRAKHAQGSTRVDAKEVIWRITLAILVLTAGIGLGILFEPRAGGICTLVVWFVTYATALAVLRPAAGPPVVLDVDASGVTLRDSRRIRRLFWDQIRSCRRQPFGDLRLAAERDADTILILSQPAFRDAMVAIERVMRGLNAVHGHDVVAPPGALSRARLTADEPADDRGLSRVEPEC